MSEYLGKPYDFSHLEDLVRPLELRFMRIAASTNDWAKQEAQSEAVRVPALFVAGSQSAGRGRGTNAWWSPFGNIAATFVLVPNAHIAFGLVPLLAGLAVRRALVRLTACEEIGLKWPNDLVVGQRKVNAAYFVAAQREPSGSTVGKPGGSRRSANKTPPNDPKVSGIGRKVAGLLCERLQRVDLLGVGVNVNAGSSEGPAELRERIMSLRELTGNVWDLTQVLCEISREVRQVFSLESENAARQMLQEYSRHHWPTGKQIELVDTDRAPRVRGRCLGIDSEGRLIVATGQTSGSFLTGSIVSVTSATE